MLLGEACNPAADCKGGACRVCTTGSCVDGVCCDSACAGTCTACSAALKQAGVDGVCGPARDGTSPVRGNCPADLATSCRRDGKCNGSGGCRLYYPGGTACGATASCADGIAVTATTCDGNGTCALGASTPCGAYACGATECKASCTTDGDCAAGSSCDMASRKCVSSATCDGDHTTTGANGEQQDCQPYKCTASGTCKQACMSIDDCVSPTQCDPSGKCVAPQSEGDAGGCAISPRSHPRSGSGILFGVLLFYLAGVRRRSRRRCLDLSSAQSRGTAEE
jgi:hypothetical protein